MNVAVHKGYVDGPFGQIHFRATPTTGRGTPLVCLHATAYSSRTFLPLMRAASGLRQVIAIDMPGYGESDAPDFRVTIADYARAIGAALQAIAPETPVALLGYHTGVYVGAELAITQPDLVDQLVLIGIPYFQALDLDLWRRKLATPHVLGDALSQFDERWAYFVTDRATGVSLRRGFENFVDELKAWPNGWWAHEAMFAYDSDARLPRVAQRALVINPVGHLAHPSRRAAALMPRAKVEELPDVSGPILEVAPDRIMQMIENFAAAEAASA